MNTKNCHEWQTIISQGKHGAIVTRRCTLCNCEQRKSGKVYVKDNTEYPRTLRCIERPIVRNKKNG